jgi:hypothetical protein
MCSRLTVREKTAMLRAISTRRCRAAYIGDLAQRRDTETSTMVAIAPTFSTPLRGVSLRLAWFGSDTLAACHISEGFDVAHFSPEPQSHGRLRRRMNCTSGSQRGHGAALTVGLYQPLIGLDLSRSQGAEHDQISLLGELSVSEGKSK